MTKTLAIITARGGSKRIPRKNIRNFHGQPIINYSISAALNSRCFSEVMVSTDDAEIAMVASNAGASIPFIRSGKTSGDYATTAEVIMEVLNNYRELGHSFDYCCCIYPTAPFVTADILNAAFAKLIESNAESVIPVVRYNFPIQRSLRIENGFIRMNWPENNNIRSQDLIPAYHDCGQFYFLKVENFVRNKKILTDYTIPFEMKDIEVQDIDNEEDWKIAEIKYSLKNHPIQHN